MDRRQVLRLLPLAGLAMIPGPTHAQSFPSRPITLLVGGGAGSNPDVLVRPIAERLSSLLGQPVVVENKPGAGGIAAMSTLARSAPDGHTLALATMAQAVFNTFMFAKLPYDALRDLEPVAPLVTGSMVLAAHPSFAANSLTDFVAMAKAAPGKHFLAVPSLGSPPHILAMLLIRAAGIEVTMVPYKTGSEAMKAVVSGEVSLMVDGPVGVAPQVQAGKLKALAVTGLQREAVLPATPTARESGINASGEAWMGIVAPAGTPADIVQRLNRDLGNVMTTPEMRSQIAGRGLRVLTSTSEEFRVRIREDHAKWGPLLREAELKLD